MDRVLNRAYPPAHSGGSSPGAQSEVRKSISFSLLLWPEGRLPISTHLRAVILSRDLVADGDLPFGRLIGLKTPSTTGSH